MKKKPPKILAPDFNTEFWYPHFVAHCALPELSQRWLLCCQGDVVKAEFEPYQGGKRGGGEVVGGVSFHLFHSYLPVALTRSLISFLESGSKVYSGLVKTIQHGAKFQLSEMIDGKFEYSSKSHQKKVKASFSLFKNYTNYLKPRALYGGWTFVKRRHVPLLLHLRGWLVCMCVCDAWCSCHPLGMGSVLLVINFSIPCSSAVSDLVHVVC